MTVGQSGAVPTRIRWFGRVSGAHVVVVLAGLLGGVLTLAALRADAHEVRVLVAAHDLRVGARLEPGDVRPVAVHGDIANLPSLVRDARAAARSSATWSPRQCGAAIRCGSPTSSPATPSNGRVVSFAVDEPTRLMATCRPVITSTWSRSRTTASDAGYVLVGAPVLAAAHAVARAVRCTRTTARVVITVSVSADDALRLAGAQANARVVVVERHRHRAARRRAAISHCPGRQPTGRSVHVRGARWLSSTSRSCSRPTRGWRSCTATSPTTVAHACCTSSSIRRWCCTSTFDVLVVSWRWPALTPGLVAELHGLGRAVLGVADRDERGAGRRAAQLRRRRGGASDAAPWEYLDALGTIEAVVGPSAARLRRSRTPGVLGAPRSIGGRTRGSRCAARPARAAPRSRSSSPAASARVLVDADEVAPAIAPRLGLPLEPNVRARDRRRRVRRRRASPTCSSASPGLAQPACCAALPTRQRVVARPPVGAVARAPCAAAPRRRSSSTRAPMLDDIGGRGARAATRSTRAIVAEADTVVAVGTGHAARCRAAARVAGRRAASATASAARTWC